MDPKNLIKRDKIYSVSSKKFYLDKNYRTAHWVGDYQLKELDTIDFYEIKQMNEEMEAELTESSEIDSKNNNLAVTEEANVDEAIPIYLKKERNKQAYRKTMDIDINKINTFEKKNKVNTIKLRPIYEVIDEAYFINSKIFSDDFLQQCKDNANDAQFIPLYMKNNIKLMETEQGLYSQVRMLRRKYLKFVAADKNKNEAKFKFQGQSARSQS